MNQTLFKEIENQMKDPLVCDKLNSWLIQADRTTSFIDAHRKTFNEWSPLKFYITLGSKDAFSIRCKGQEIAQLRFIAGRPTVFISDAQTKSNLRNFKFSPKCNKFQWVSDEGAAFRKHFSNALKQSHFHVHSEEHRIESEIISSLTSRSKPSCSSLRNRTAVTLCDFPLQFPVPFSASKGTIGKTNGHIDILGRRPGGVLSVWELKKPDLCGSAPRQAYIYALQIYFMIYDPHMGKKWLELFGFGRESQTVRIEIVLGLSNSQNGKAMAGITKIRDEMKLDGIDSLFSWHIANYSIAHDMHTMSINKVP